MAVIGAGIAGLVTAKVLRDDGFDVVVFEKEPTIGGVWAESRTYLGLRTNNTRDTYAFSDHPYSRSADLFPTAAQVREYLASYLERFRLQPQLRLCTEVLEVGHRAPDPGAAGAAPTEADRHAPVFEVRTRTGGEESTQLFDFVVVCSGVFSQPHLPQIEGRHRFLGRLLHSSEATDPDLLAGKRVVIVGAGKSALDLATWAASHASSTTLLFRAAHWMIPRYLPGRIPIDRLLMTRANEAMLSYHRLSRAEEFLHGRGKRLTRLLWLMTTGLMRLLLRMPAPMVPDKPMPAGIEKVGVQPEFYRLARAGRILMRRSTITAFPGGNALWLSNDDWIDADVVIFATGWKQTLPFLAPDLAAIAKRDGYFQLYRNILPPTEPRLGFIGYAASPAGQLTAEVSAHWLSQAFRNELALPSPEQMQAEIQRVQAWRTDIFPTQPQGHVLGPFMVHHLDELLTDMGLPTRRTTNVLTEHLRPLYPTRYAGLTEERRRHRQGA